MKNKMKWPVLLVAMIAIAGCSDERFSIGRNSSQVEEGRPHEEQEHNALYMGIFGRRKNTAPNGPLDSNGTPGGLDQPQGSAPAQLGSGIDPRAKSRMLSNRAGNADRPVKSLDQLQIDQSVVLASHSGVYYSGVVKQLVGDTITLKTLHGNLTLDRGNLQKYGVSLKDQISVPNSVPLSAPVTQRQEEVPYRKPSDMYSSGAGGKLQPIKPGDQSEKGNFPVQIGKTYLFIVDSNKDLLTTLEGQDGYFWNDAKGQRPRLVKHRDMNPIDEAGNPSNLGNYGGPGYLGGEMKAFYDSDNRIFIAYVNLSSSLSFARKDGKVLHTDPEVQDYISRKIAASMEGEVVVIFSYEPDLPK